MKLDKKVLSVDNIELKKGNIEDLKKVYEYDFRKLNEIFEPVRYIEASSE